MEVFGGLDTLGDQPGVDAAGELAEHLDERRLCRVTVQVRNQRTVELHEIGVQRQDVMHAGISRAGVVHSNKPAEFTHSRDGCSDLVVVGDDGVFGQLEDHAVKRPVLEQSLYAIGKQHVGGDVHRQERPTWQRGSRRQYLLEDECTEFGLLPDARSRREPLIGAHRALRREPAQRLVADDPQLR